LERGMQTWIWPVRPGAWNHVSLGTMGCTSNKVKGDPMFSTHETIAGRTAVITGGSGVLCSEMARQLVAQKVNVAILNRTAEKWQSVANVINGSGGKVIAVDVDVLDRASLEKAKEQILEAYGRIDILINGAGGNHPDAITDIEL